MPPKQTRVKKAHAKKKRAEKIQPSIIPLPNIPPADGSSPFTKLPLEIHMVIGDKLKADKQLGALAKLARTSRHHCSFYEQQLYKGRGNTHNIDALMWGARKGSIPSMKNANGWGANLDTRTNLFGYRPYSNRPNAEGTALQLAIRGRQNQSMRWLFNEGVLVDLPDKPARNMCRCDQGWNAPDTYASSLHIAICTGNLDAVKLILRVRHEAEASLQFSQKFDHVPILHTAVLTAFREHSLDILDVALENSIIRKSINEFKSEGGRTTLAMVLHSRATHYGHFLTEQILTALVKAGASLGPYPPGSIGAGTSPLMDEIYQCNLQTNAKYLLQLGCDPNGDRPHPITPEWTSPLHVFIRPEHRLRNFNPSWQPMPVTKEWPIDVGSENRDFIILLLKHGASLDITNFEGMSPLDNATSYMARYLAPSRRVVGFKFMKLLLANVRDKGISKESRKRAEDIMATLVQDLRAEHATHDLSDIRARLPSKWEIDEDPDEEDWDVEDLDEEDWDVEDLDEEESEPIRLGWHAWMREGGRLRRK